MPTRKSAKRSTPQTAINIDGDAKCADFIGGDKVTTTYGFSATEVDHLIDKVLAFLQAGATFVPRGELLRAEIRSNCGYTKPSGSRSPWILAHSNTGMK